MRTRVIHEKHDLVPGRLRLFKRRTSDIWQCAAFLDHRTHRASTKEQDLKLATRFAEDWYLSLKVRDRKGELSVLPRFKEAAERFVPEYEALTAGERSPRYVKQHSEKLRVHLLPYFGEMPVAHITDQTVLDYRVHRTTSRKNAKGEILRPSRSAIHHEIVTLRHVLKTAKRAGWIKSLPDLSSPYKASGKISHRAWFSPTEYKQLYTATRERAEKPPKPRWKWECEQLHDFVLFMVNTGLRPDEAARLEFRDVEIVKDKATKETILEISVRGKRGTGYCKSMPGAVIPFERLRSRKRAVSAGARASLGGSVDGDKSLLRLPTPTDLLFPRLAHHHFNAVLDEEGLKRDREGLPRTAYSLRHTYICLRLMEGADIYAIAKNCRTSVEMIEKYYASHIKNMIDTAAVNVRSSRSDEPRPKKRTNGKPRANGRKFTPPKGRR